MQPRLLSWLGIALTLLVAPAWAKSSTGDKVLIVTDAKLEMSDYSQFWDGLRSRGYELTFRKTSEDEPATSAFDVPSFSHIILLAPSAKTYPQDLSPQSLVHLLSDRTQPTNILFVLQPSTPSVPLRDLAREFGISFPPPATPLIDYFSAVSPANATSLLLSPPLSQHTAGFESGKILYHGISHLRSSNPLLVNFLNAPPTSYAADPLEPADAVVEAAASGGEGLWAGGRMGLVTGFEVLLGGGRAMWVGSLDLFADAATSIDGEATANNAYALALAAWTFQETSVLRIDAVEHRRISESAPREQYRIKDEIIYRIHVSKFDPTTGEWVPTSEIEDMQLEFTMLDPHIRTALKPASEEGWYEAQFMAPDRHGVFKFIVDWRRKGYTALHSSTTVSVVPFRHNEYPRFLSSAWPYYLGALSTSAAFVLFCALWLLGGDEEAKKKKTQ
ncbi:Dolichyl-diphosphooligosaccharide-protein glycosyltransferase 48kDa subunit [Calocera viscosa TUFC12733]|uniref:Dolichyl-diphosphooligosaccharide--protein glycosyltransferase subunit WBP1 n=1 Tax=Calocera viscosa (strain TUFC12733) TaxID=1330018 RepID=A0A167KX53_CALVF|nr:Dolichyl-diphosphooligosaccharide-protein glycosyltransferase 48kDa subunit [Calocera viscosa TUFC12733]